jgi:hypothetical protein
MKGTTIAIALAALLVGGCATTGGHFKQLKPPPAQLAKAIGEEAREAPRAATLDEQGLQRVLVRIDEVDGTKDQASFEVAVTDLQTTMAEVGTADIDLAGCLLL